jgi:hypothetical protein
VKPSFDTLQAVWGCAAAAVAIESGENLLEAAAAARVRELVDASGATRF